MTEDEYNKACQSASNFPYVDDARWNRDYRKSLDLNGLKLTENEPVPSGFYIQAPIPTPTTRDPYSWNVPSWIIEK